MKQLVILLLLLAATCFPISSRAGDPIKKWAVIRADGSVAHDLSMWDYPQIRPLSSNLVEVTYKVQNLQRVSPVLLDQPVEPQLENWCDSVMVHPEGIVVCSRGRYLKLFSQDMEPLVSFAPDNETYIRRYLGEGFFVGVTKKENRESHALYRINEGRPELISSRYGPEFGRFMDGVCPVARNGHWGMIDAQGKLIISWLYDRPFRLQDGVAFVERDGEPYWINQNGIRVAAPDKSVAARIEVQTPELGSNSWVVAEHNRILTPTIEGWSITDLDGKIIMPPSPYWLDLVPGDNGLILAASEKGWGYLDMDGKEVIAPNYPYASPFVDGIAVVQTIFSDPVLAVFPYPQRWFFENIDKNRNFSIYSLARPGEKYGMVYAGQMKDGVPHGVGTICWPGRGKVPVTMSHGKLLDMRVATLEDGTKVIGSIDETLSGRGYDNYPNGKNEVYWFVEEWETMEG